MKHKNYDYQSIDPFEKLQQRKGWAGCCSKKCFKYYKKNTDKNINESIKFTFKYIKSYYADKRCNKNMSSRDEKKNVDILLERYKELDNSSKYSISIITSSVSSFIISLFFAIFTFSYNGQNSYFSEIVETFDSLKNNIVNYELIVKIILVLIIVPIFLFFLFPIVCACLYPIYASKALCFMNATYKQIIVPYEIDVIIETLTTYNPGYSKLK